MTNRPYVAEQEKLFLEESIQTFQQVRYRKNAEKVESINSHAPKSNKKTMAELKIEERKSMKEVIFLFLMCGLIFACFAVSVSMFANVNEMKRKVYSVEESNQFLMGQNQHLETMLLADVDGMPYREYAVNVLGMKKAPASQYKYIDSSIYEKKHKKEHNITEDVNE